MPIFVVLLIAAVVEISVLVLVAQAIGVLPTLGLLVGGAILGTWLVRREGRRTLAEFREAAFTRRPAERELSDGVLIAGGGLLILLPGLVSDVAGLVFLFPPTRSVLRRRMMRSAERRAKTMRDRMWLHAQRAQRQGGVSFGTGGAAFGGGGSTRDRGANGAAGGGDVIDGEVVSVSEDDAEQQSGNSGSGTDQPNVLPPRRDEPGTA